jgi:hypothetical protein
MRGEFEESKRAKHHDDTGSDTYLLIAWEPQQTVSVTVYGHRGTSDWRLLSAESEFCLQTGHDVPDSRDHSDLAASYPIWLTRLFNHRTFPSGKEESLNNGKVKKKRRWP